MVDSILAAFQMSINAETLLIVFIGAFYGTIIGALPGLGTVVALTMCLPFTLHMENVPAIALLLAVYCGSVFGGSISAVLINTPGTPQSAATGMDGYPMAKRGQAGLRRPVGNLRPDLPWPSLHRHTLAGEPDQRAHDGCLRASAGNRGQ